MLKNKLFVLGLSCFLSACSIYNFSNAQLFVIGTWIGEPLTEKTHLQYVLKFLPFNILLVDIRTPTETGNNFLFSYHLTDKNQILIDGRFVEKLEISKQNNNLMSIQSEQGFIPAGYYRRVTYTNLDFLIGLLLLVLLLSLIYRYLKSRRAAE